MFDAATSPHPTDQDRDNARIRAIIAERQKTEFDECQRLADMALGPGYSPWMKLSLMDSDHRQTGNREPIATVYKVYRGEARLTENSVFMRRTPDGQALCADNFEALFGDLLHEPHPTLRFEVKGQMVAAPRWTLCWSALERYQPKTAEELAALRASRKQKAAEREERKWREDNPLLSWAEQTKAEEESKTR